MSNKTKPRVVWAVESKGSFEFCNGHSKAMASRRARTLGQIAKEYGPYRVVKFVEVRKS